MKLRSLNENESTQVTILKSSVVCCQVVTILSSKRPGFNPEPAFLGYVLDKVAVGQLFLCVLQFHLDSIIPSIFYSCFIHLSWTLVILAMDSITI